MSKWQPMETAPKDGTSILTFGRLPGSYGYSDEEYCCSVSFWCQTGWISQRSISFGNSFIPTHWMDLPEVPSQ